MSRQCALDALNGIMPDRIPQWDLPDHPKLASGLLEYDIWEDVERTALDLWKHFDIDLVTGICDGLAEWNFPLVRYYSETRLQDTPDTAAYRRAFRQVEKKPYTSMYDELGMTSSGLYLGLAPTMVMNHTLFQSPDDVLRFEPLKHDHADYAQRVDFFQRHYLEKQLQLGNHGQYVGWYYHTLFMWPVEVFNWENFMLAAMTDEDRFACILQDFFELTYRDIRAMCQVDFLPAIFCHDDLCSATGPMFAPEWYRKMIYPYYERIVDLIHEHGKKAVFVCDGNLTPILADLADIWKDGLAVDGNVALEDLKKFYSGRIMLGGMPASVVSSGSEADIRRMVSNTVELMRDEPGYFFQCVALNGTTPLQNVRAYMDAVNQFALR